MIFANLEYLFLLLLLIPYIVWYFMRRKKTEPTMQVSSTRMYMNLSSSCPFCFENCSLCHDCISVGASSDN